MSAHPVTAARPYDHEPPEDRLSVRGATTPADLDEVRRLWSSFRDWLGLRYAGAHAWVVESYFDEAAWADELSSLPGAYGGDHGGVLLLAHLGRRAVGTVALRALDGERCEMKRMFVADEARGRGVGDLLVVTLLDQARALGYREMVLDTGFRQHEATRLYRKHGFQPSTPPYAVDPRLAAGGLTFMRRSVAGR